ncbi:mRNA cleavage factor complex component Pcf11 [Penicillium macrosclerotiorum]|uniref:mRNA cleavage factor complex component Pcf11 n=1 Tax=Penicillium macrosclerotiorum TaxID=303699 RepID=UPI002546B0F7|nr:mRNA cleavage factor complex component Pcf11 [Penicillium macrosclerotiorum]KAJ5693302.1 mRNA cleavage factor complex component Pcf11 [Penicillium macrosclerotiorum]
MSGLLSDEVAEDYKNSLEDLTSNDRFQISNLTVIAKENTEHAMAISRVLENHIRSTPPPQKLPALYVVDSIVKNVGTPYTLFLGRNMYQTFMNAYTLVDSQTRRKLDEMLKTWKEPVPGSLETRPVFAPEITRNIENALIKARTAALHQEQARGSRDILNRGRGSATPTGWTNSPTPPQPMPRQPNVLPNHNKHPGPGLGTSTPPQGHRPDADLEALNRDLEACILSARNDFANAPFDTPSQQRLKALLDLQTIMRNQQLTPDQLKLVRDQISAYAGPKQTPAPPNPPPSVAPVVAPPPAAVSAPPTPSLSQPLQQLLNSGTLADLIKATAIPQQPTPPPHVPNALPPMPRYPPPNNTPQPENPLIAALRLRGLLPPASAPPAMGSSGTPAGGPLPFLIPGQMRSTPPVPTPQVSSIPTSSSVPMNTASMKIPRFSLIALLYDAKPNRCGTCGRRFATTEEGRRQKARHLDWHFKTNQRMADASKRAQTRSWYVDERDWIKSRETGDDQISADTDAATEGAAGADGNAAKQGPPKVWIRAPNDATLRNTPCPICQEKFESTWSEDVQDWIWEDATKVGNRVYHASCYAEVTKGGPPPRSSTPQARTGTPDSVLGKRKADGTDSPGAKTRVKMEPM